MLSNVITIMCILFNLIDKKNLLNKKSRIRPHLHQKFTWYIGLIMKNNHHRANTKLYLTSSLTFLKTNIQETHFLSFSTDPSKSEISAHFALFSLKERARKLPWVFLLSPRVHTHQKKDKSPSYLLFDSFKAWCMR